MNHILKRRKKCLLIQEHDDIKNVIKLKKNNNIDITNNLQSNRNITVHELYRL